MPTKNSSAAAFLAALIVLPFAHGQGGNALRSALKQDDAGIVQGQPCSIVETTKTAQQLADGTMLTRSTVEHKWRDQQGRFRKEIAEVEPGHDPITRDATIMDPVSNTVAILNLDNKVANVFHLPDSGPYHLHPYVDLDDKDDDIMARPGVQVHVEKLKGTFVGVYAEGRRVMRVRPPGTIGNDRTVTSVSERWVSPDLKILLFSKMDDPREKQIRQVTNLDRSLPDPQLFKIPPDFSVHEFSADAAGKISAY